MTDVRKIPKTYLKFREDYPEVAKNYEALGESLAEIGALEKRTVALVKLALAVAHRWPLWRQTQLGDLVGSYPTGQGLLLHIGRS